MRRTLKLLLLLGIGLALAKNKNGDGITPGDGDNTIDPTTGKPKSDEQRKKDTDYNGTSAQDNFDGVMKQGDQESQSGRSQNASNTSSDSPANGPIPYRSDGDPAADVFGPGRESNPQEWNQLLDEARAAGVEINHDTTNIGYTPGLRPGQPGQLSIPENASYSALMHEMNHLRDDQNVGWGGFQQAYDSQFMAQSETDAYQVEIDYANQQGNPELAQQLEDLRDARLQQIADDEQSQREMYEEDNQ